ncbi:MAG TPA: ATP-binding protein [Rhodocyclaceae bacterium]|nr:ATP-binding protein [Rhodocyclaceae bacterium]
MKLGRLFWKFFFAFWLALLLAGVGVGAAVWWHHQADLEQRERERDPALAGGPRAGWAVASAAAVLAHGGTPAVLSLLDEWGAEGRAPRLLVVDEAGHDLLGRPVSAEALASARRRADHDHPAAPVRQVLSADGRTYLLFVPADAGNRGWEGVPPGPPPGLDLPGRPPGPPFERRRPPDRPGLGVLIASGLLASVLVSALLAWYLAKPVRHLRWAFGAVADGRLDTRVSPLMGARRDEIADLGVEFDRMAGQLQALVGAQRRLLHDVSHELRSPLARMQAAIGLARQDASKLPATIDRIERESVRLDELVGQLLTLARLDAGSGDAPEEAVDLIDLVAAIADDARFEAETLGKTVHFVGDGQALTRVRAELIQRAFENVIRNAVKFTAVGTAVDVTVGVIDGRFRLRVADRGPGVSESDLATIFEPFHRGRAAVTAGGFGLGLAIARRAVTSHGGQIEASNRDGGGLEVSIVLPLAG